MLKKLRKQLARDEQNFGCVNYLPSNTFRKGEKYYDNKSAKFQASGEMVINLSCKQSALGQHYFGRGSYLLSKPFRRDEILYDNYFAKSSSEVTNVAEKIKEAVSSR